MKNDYTYCLSQNCIHKRGCKRNIENYPDKEVKELYTENIYEEEVESDKCINS